ncbi:MAG: hypothetical protein JXB50_01095 [Spirochaetes bacterium]|nr:hypothetical protein [Spirochaetota bacterium]
MLNSYKINMPKLLKKLNYGFSVYEKSYIIVEEAVSMSFLNNKYPDALSIIQI